MSFNEDKMQIHAHIADATYKRSKISKGRELEKYYGDRFSLIAEETDAIHTVFKDNSTGKYIIGIRGTDIQDKQNGKVKDLLADAAVSFGLTKLTNRYKKSDKKVGSLIKKYGKDNVSLASHSLGASVARELVFKHDVESHGFNSGGTALTFNKKFRGFHKDTKAKIKKNNVYFVNPSLDQGVGFDPLSVGTQGDLYASHHFVAPKKLKKKDQGVIAHHSIKHFHKDDLVTQGKQSLREAGKKETRSGEVEKKATKSPATRKEKKGKDVRETAIRAIM